MKRKYILIVAMFFSIIVLIWISRGAMVTLIGLTEEQASTIAGIGQVVVEAVAAIMIIFQLEQEQNTEKRQNDIEEAQFILKYNQAFIQDQRMGEIEHRLELHREGYLNEPLVNEENRQNFINYLVYLEGLAPLVLRGILQLDTIDNLMAYRFFLAMNNTELQEDQLFQYPEYYRGCFSMYYMWKEYRRKHQYEILDEGTSVDQWIYFEKYSGRNICVRSLEETDDYKRVGEIIYGTDPYIYPAAFGTLRNARRNISSMLQKGMGIFRPENVRVIVEDDILKGAAIVLTNETGVAPSIEEVYKQIKHLPDSFRDVYEKYLLHLPDYLKEHEVYIAAICVDENYRGKGIGEILLKNIVHEFSDQSILLHVLDDNEAAIKLYQKYGFTISGELEEGYAYKAKAPMCYAMEKM